MRAIRAGRVALGTAALVLGLALVGGGCSDDGGEEEPPTTAADGSLTVTGLLAEQPTGEVAVRGALYADLTSVEGGEPVVSLTLCDRVGEADVPDVPFLECQGAAVLVGGGPVDPWLLDLRWSSADGTDDYSRPVTVRGTYARDRFEVVAVEVDGTPVEAPRPTEP